jgi:S1-C subfamily serine protease
VTTEASGFPDTLAGIDLSVKPNVRVLLEQTMRNVPRVEVTTSLMQGGIRVDQLTDQLRDFFGVPGNNGVLVSYVESGSAAEKAGLKAGDVITEVNGRAIRTPGDFSRESRTAGGKGTLKIMREKQERTINLD